MFPLTVSLLRGIQITESICDNKEKISKADFIKKWDSDKKEQPVGGYIEGRRS